MKTIFKLFGHCKHGIKKSRLKNSAQLWNKISRLHNLAHKKNYEKFEDSEQYVPFISFAKKANRENAKVLDVGCGRGRVMKYFNNIIGVDVSEELLKSSIVPEKPLILADALKGLPFKDKCFDYTFACNVVGHFDDDQTKILSEMIRVTSKEILFNLYYLWTIHNIVWKFTNYLSMLRRKYLPIFGRQTTFRKARKLMESVKFKGTYKMFRIKNYLFIHIFLTS
jgi:ubiquinone/menaquinone biosynthesis C-methylase UbiE